ncbi:type II toxin-antitoxin system Phd/YefM family antitoxin [Rhodocista pekingensis]|uniref:Type II toxin-antitoxin system Phd/YefM family antitoxin n=1 Tax=Rhodocista pekingensis TaxID=201185 RepID=A0ABW2KTM5_9PROT
MGIWISKQEAAARIGELLDRAEAGEDFVITVDGEPALHLRSAAADGLAAIERDIQDSLDDAANGRLVRGDDLVAELTAGYERAFGSRRAGDIR